MTTPSHWSTFYEELPGGQHRITGANLTDFETGHPDRVFSVPLAGKPTKVLLLDLPFRVDERQLAYDAYYLRRIPLRDIPGWMPTAAPMGEGHRFLSLKECRLKSAKYKSAHAGQAGLEITVT